MKNRRTFYGLLSGLIVYAVTGSVGLYLLHTCWPGYAAAVMDKSYSVDMLLGRLSVGLVASVLAGIIATKIANNKGNASWFVGAIVFSIAAYIHVCRVWADYPVWYHFAYLLPIIPLSGLSHYLSAKKKQR